MRIAMLVFLVGCGTDRDPIDDPQLPPRGHDDLETWLAAGYHQSWRCQPTVHEAMPPSPHPSARICSNALIYETSDGEFPVGAATVKELFLGAGDPVPHGYAVTRKVGAGVWYWYEANEDGVYADGTHEPTCIDCHSNAARDFVWTMAP